MKLRKGNRGASWITVLVSILAVILVAGIIFFYASGMAASMKKSREERLSARYYSEAEKFDSEKKWDEGIAYFQKEMKKHPHMSALSSCLGFVYLKKGEIDQAIPVLEQSLKEDPVNSRTCAVLGKAYLIKGDLEKATIYFDMGIKLTPAFPKAHSNMADALARRGLLGDAIGHFRKAKDLDASITTPTYLLGIYEAGRRNYKTAVEIEEKALLEEPDNLAAHCFLGITYLEMGDNARAMETFEGAQKLAADSNNPRFQSVIFTGMGTACYNLNEYERALSFYESASKLENTSTVHKKMGDVYTKQGMSEKAAAEYRMAKRLEDQHKKELEKKEP